VIRTSRYIVSLVAIMSCAPLMGASCGPGVNRPPSYGEAANGPSIAEEAVGPVEVARDEEFRIVVAPTVSASGLLVRAWVSDPDAPTRVQCQNPDPGSDGDATLDFRCVLSPTGGDEGAGPVHVYVRATDGATFHVTVSQGGRDLVSEDVIIARDGIQ
jgi:hypothetical protein